MVLRVRRRRWLVAVLGLSALFTVAACDQAPSRVETTDRALAAVAAEHLGAPEYAVREAFGMASEFDGDLVQTTLVYPTPDPPSGATETHVQVLAGTGFLHDGLVRCATSYAEPWCVDLDGGGTLIWSLVDPEESPGSVEVTVAKGATTVQVALYGPLITGDPRTLTLPVDLDALVATAQDDRVDTSTTPATVAAGAELDFWRAGGVVR